MYKQKVPDKKLYKYITTLYTLEHYQLDLKKLIIYRWQQQLGQSDLLQVTIQKILNHNLTNSLCSI